MGAAEFDVFPEVDPLAAPLGARILVQIRSVKMTSSGGIIIAKEARDNEKYNTNVSKIIALGPLAFKNRATMQDWPEGMWVKVGDFVRAPRFGGDRWEVKVEGREEPALFAIFGDHEIIAKITGDHNQMTAFF